ncbi:MAG: LPS biosynthesis choline kinase [Pseudonocardiales bacterium]|nr:MAG: LPS biosynthesis choline kinase [Pseudonocardiales bacterium]
MTAQQTGTAGTVNRCDRPVHRTDRDVLDDALDRLPEFRGLTRYVQPVPGGLTNRIYKVTPSSGRTVVARLSSGKSALLAIDRTAECHNAKAAARAGVGPRVIACEPDEGVAIVEWINGRTFGPRDLDDSAQLARVAATCARLHNGPRFANDFDMFAIQRRYLAVVTERHLRLPDRYLEFMPRVEDIRAALAVRAQRTVPCHNDLLAANIMDDAQQIWFIDYEYAGNNDACFELGNIWSESNLGLDRLEELVGSYFGYESRAKVARARLLALMSKYGWTLWASIQDAVSEVEFDFWSWGLEKYERAVAEFDGPEFSRLIDEVQQPD